MKASVRSIALFCALAFAPVWAVCAVLLVRPVTGVLLTLIFSGFMLVPAAASVLTRLIRKEGFQDMRLRPRFRGHAGAYVLAWLLPIGLTVLGAVLYFIRKPHMFDPSCTMLRVSGVAEDKLPTVLLMNGILMLAGPLLNFIPALGEELGWRGYLLPKLAARMRPRAAALLSGCIWGLWHAPMIALGHNYGFGYWGFPWAGILLMTVFCMAFGAFLAWLTFHTRSTIPAALAHGGLNAVAAIGLLCCLPGYNALIGPAPVGLIGGIPTLLAGVLCLLLIRPAKAEPEMPEDGNVND